MIKRQALTYYAMALSFGKPMSNGLMQYSIQYLNL